MTDLGPLHNSYLDSARSHLNECSKSSSQRTESAHLAYSYARLGLRFSSNQSTLLFAEAILSLRETHDVIICDSPGDNSDTARTLMLLAEQVLDQMLLPATENGHSSNGGTQDNLLDAEYHAYAEDHQEPSVDREQVRKALKLR